MGYEPSYLKPITPTEQEQAKQRMSSSAQAAIQSDLQPIDPNRQEKERLLGQYFVQSANEQDRLYDAQGAWERTQRSAVKFAANTVANVGGGLLGTAYGIVEASSQGDISKLWDNEIIKFADEFSKNREANNQVYKSSAYADRMFYENMFKEFGSFLDDSQTSLAFIAGAVATEYITAGLGSGVAAVMGARYLNTINKGVKTLNTVDRMFDAATTTSSYLQKMASGSGKALDFARRSMTGAAFEASIEAYHTADESKKRYIDNFILENGRVPDENETKFLEDQAIKAGNATYFTNLAILSASNAMQIPEMFGYKRLNMKLSASQTSKYFDDLARGVTANAPKIPSKLDYAVAIAKNSITEGIEEGAQSIASSVYSNYYAPLYNKDKTVEAISFVKSATDTISDKMKDKDFWNEVGLGLVIGTVGLGPFGGGAYGAYKDTRKEYADQKKYYDMVRETNSLTVAKGHFEHLARTQETAKAMQVGLGLGSDAILENAKSDTMHSFVMNRIANGIGDTIDTELEEFKKLPLEDAAKAANVSDENSKYFTEKTRDEYIKNVQAAKVRMEKAYEAAESLVARAPKELRESKLADNYKKGLAMSIAALDHLDAREKDINDRLANLTGTLAVDKLRKQAEEHSDKKAKLDTMDAMTDSIIDTIDSDAARKSARKDLNDFRKAENKMHRDRYNQAVQQFITEHPQDADELRGLLADLNTIASTKEAIGNHYNSVKEEKGAKELFDKMEADRLATDKALSDFFKGESVHRREAVDPDNKLGDVVTTEKGNVEIDSFNPETGKYSGTILDGEHIGFTVQIASTKKTAKEWDGVVPTKKEPNDTLLDTKRSEADKLSNEINAKEKQLASLESLLEEALPKYSILVEDINKKINTLKSLVTSKSKNKTAKGKNITTQIAELKESIRLEAGTVKTLTEAIKTLEQELDGLYKIQKDLKQQVIFYERLFINDVNGEALNAKLKQLKTQEQSLYSYINKINLFINSIKKEISLLIDSIFRRNNTIDRILTREGFKKPTGIIEGFTRNGSINDNYDDIKTNIDKIEVEINSKIDSVEDKEALLTSLNNEVFDIEKQLIRVQDKIRYIEELLAYNALQVNISNVSNNTKTVTEELEKAPIIIHVKAIPIQHVEETPKDIKGKELSIRNTVIDSKSSAEALISELKEEKAHLQSNGVDVEVQKIEADIAKLNKYIKDLEFSAAPTGTKHEDLYRKSNAAEKNNSLAIFTRTEDWMSGMENTPQVLRNLIAYTTNVPVTDHKVRIQKPTKEQLEALGSTGAPNMLIGVVTNSYGMPVNKDGIPTDNINEQCISSILENPHKDSTQQDKDAFKASREAINRALATGKEVYVTISGKTPGTPSNKDSKESMQEMEKLPLTSKGIDPNNVSISIVDDVVYIVGNRAIRTDRGDVMLHDNERGHVTRVQSRLLSEQDVLSLEAIINSAIRSPEKTTNAKLTTSVYTAGEKQVNLLEAVSSIVNYGRNSNPDFKFDFNIKDTHVLFTIGRDNFTVPIENGKLKLAGTFVAEQLMKTIRYNVKKDSLNGSFIEFKNDGAGNLTHTTHQSYNAYLLESDRLYNTLLPYDTTDKATQPPLMYSELVMDLSNPTVKETTKVLEVPSEPTVEEGTLEGLLASINKEKSETVKEEYNPYNNSDEDFRLAGTYTKPVSQTESEWFVSAFPTIPYSVVDRLINGNAWGMFAKNAVTIYNMAGEGTVYHEAFHVVSRLYLTKKQQAALYKEYADRNGLPANTSLREIEEGLANDFMNFMLTGDLSKYKTKQKSFFRQLVDTIKHLIFGKPATIANVFEKISKGGYAKAAIVNSNNTDAYYRLPKLPANVVADYLESAKYHVFNGMKRDLYKLLLPNNHEYVDRYLEVFRADIRGYNKFCNDRLATELSESDRLHYETLLDSNNTLLENFEEFKNIFSDYLKRYSIETDLSEDTIRDTGSKDSKNDPSKEVYKLSQLRTASTATKLLIASLPKVDKVTGKNFVGNVGLRHCCDFSSTMAMFANKLANCRTVPEMHDKLVAMSSNQPLAKVLINRLKLDQYLNSSTEMAGDDIYMINQFFQSFAKAKSGYEKRIYDNGNSVVIDSVQDGLTTRLKFQWKTNALKTPGLYKKDNGIDVYDNSGAYFNNLFKTYTATRTKSKEENFVGAVEALKGIGVTLNNTEAYSDEDRQTLIQSTNYTLGLIKEGKLLDLYDGQEKRDLRTFTQLQEKYNFDVVENFALNMDGEEMYTNSLNTYYSFVLNEINSSKTLAELATKLPFLKDTYSQSSLLLKPGGQLFDAKGNKIAGKEISLSVLQGASISSAADSGTGYDVMMEGDRLKEMIENSLRGKLHIIRPADNKLERLLTVDGGIQFVEKGNIKQAVDLAIDHMIAEKEKLAEMVDDTQKYKGAIPSTVFFTSIYNNQPAKDIFEDFKADKITAEQFKASSEVRIALEVHFDNRAKELFNRCEQLGLVAKEPAGELYDLVGLDNVLFNTDSGKIPQARLLQELKDSYTQYIFGVLENTKLFTGHPSYYKNADNFYKRQSALVGTKRATNVDPQLNKWMNKNMSRLDGKAIDVDNPKVRTLVVADISAVSKVADVIKELTGVADYNEGPNKEGINEADAQGYCTTDFYRDMLFRSGQWTPALEMLYQYEVAYSKEPGILSFQIENSIFPELNGRVVSKSQLMTSGVTWNVMKPQHFGPEALEADDPRYGTYTPVMYKTSLIPLVPSAMAEYNASDIFKMMQTQGVDVLLFESANKVGTRLSDKNELPKLYNEEGVLNTNYSNFIPQETYTKYWGVQVDVANKVKDKITTGTQMMQHILSGMVVEGEPLEGYEDLYNEALSVNEQRLEMGMKNLKEMLGVEEIEGGYKYSKAGYDKLISKLKQQVLSRDFEENYAESLENIRSITGLDGVADKAKLEEILYSLADSTAISMKRFGGGRIQGASTLFEPKGTKRTIKKIGDKNYTESNDLEFYYNSDGKLVGMEIKLPHYFKELLGKDFDITQVEDPRLLQLIGFRIPTQGLNSIEFVKIKEFLPPHMGELVVVPTEITKKAGSDFDVDKLNIYLPNYKIVDGKPVYVEYIPGGNNSLEAIENRLLEIHLAIVKKILLDPNRASEMLQSIDQNVIEETVKELDKATKDPNKLKVKYSGLHDMFGQVQKAVEFQEAKAGVGVSAVHAKSHIAAQQSNWVAAYDISLPHNVVEEGVAIGSDKSKDKFNISSLLSQAMNAFVDAAKDPYIFRLGVNIDTANLFHYLLRAGVPPKTVGYFFAQPIIREMIVRYRKANAITLRSAKDEVDKTSFVEVKNTIHKEITTKYKVAAQTTKAGGKSVTLFNIDGEMVTSYSITQKDLEHFIKTPINEISEKDAGKALYILNEFTKLNKQASDVASVSKVVSYDTNEIKSKAELDDTLDTMNEVLSETKLSGASAYLASGFITPYYNNTKILSKIFRPLYSIENNPKYIEFRDKIFTGVGKLFKTEDRHRLNKKVYEGFTAYMMQTTPFVLNGIERAPLKAYRSKLFKGENSVANRIASIKNNPKHPYYNNALINSIEPILRSNPREPDTVRLIANKLNSVDAGLLTQAWRELFSDSNIFSLGEDLLYVAMMQDGVRYSKSSFLRYAPNEIRQEVFASMVDNLNPSNAFVEEFLLNNPQYIRKESDQPFQRSYIKKLFKDTAEKAKRKKLGLPLYDITYTIRGTAKQITPKGFEQFSKNLYLYVYDNESVETRDKQLPTIEVDNSDAPAITYDFAKDYAEKLNKVLPLSKEQFERLELKSEDSLIEFIKNCL